MPFRITTQPFGALPDATEPLIEYVLEHPETGEFLTVLPDYGGILRRLVLRKGENLFSLLKGPESPQALFADESYASALLYPFPGRIHHGLYTHEGKIYKLRTNEVSRENALHGFVHGRRFSVVHQETTPTYARLVVRYDYAGELDGYPFPFSLTVAYDLAQANQVTSGSDPAGDRMCALRVGYSAQNTGTTAGPAAFGWHPYFTLSAEPVGQQTLTLPARMPVALDDALIPTGRQPPVAAETLSLHDRQMDTPFVLVPGQSSASGASYAETILTSQQTGVRLIVGQEMGPGKLNYLVCYLPPRRDSIAIEPQTASPNAFNNGDGLIILNPGDALTGTMWVRLN